ncbi:DUF4214 domain-containing protein, partial [Methylobacterium mesophilicum]
MAIWSREKKIKWLYSAVLGRDGEPEAIEYCANDMEKGVTLEDMLDRFIQSQECQPIWSREEKIKWLYSAV